MVPSLVRLRRQEAVLWQDLADEDELAREEQERGGTGTAELRRRKTPGVFDEAGNKQAAESAGLKGARRGLRRVWGSGKALNSR